MFLLCIFTKEQSQKCEKSRICLQTLDRLREFCSDSNQQCTRVREDGFQGKESLGLEKCPSITGRSSELKNPLPSWDAGPKVAQKVCRALVLWCVKIACYGLKQQALAQASFCVPVLWHEMCSRTPQACVCVWMFALCVVSRMAVLALQWYHWTTASWESRSPGGVTCGCGGSCHTLITHLQSGSWLSLLSVLPVLMWALKFLTGFLPGSIV